MARLLINKYIWLIETIRKAGPDGITLADINERWRTSYFYDTPTDIPKKTFQNWKDQIESTFGIEIKCNRRTNAYYIDSVDDRSKTGEWLLSTFSVVNSIIDCEAINDRILTEPIPSVRTYFSTLVDAMKQQLAITIHYQSYTQSEEHARNVFPYCLKLFKQRWYLLCYSLDHQGMRIYALDRIHDISLLTSLRFDLPSDFDPSTYFADYFGVYIDTQQQAQDIVIRADNTTSKYLADLPLHSSQRLLHATADYSDWGYHLVPTYDFIQHLLSLGETIRIVEPQSLVDAMKQKLKRMIENYG